MSKIISSIIQIYNKQPEHNRAVFEISSAFVIMSLYVYTIIRKDRNKRNSKKDDAITVTVYAKNCNLNDSNHTYSA